MKILVIGGNRFVGLRLCMALDRDPNIDLTVLNRTGQSPHLKRAAIYKGDRRNLALAGVDQDFDVVVDFACYDDVDAQSSLSYFGKIGRYIFISTASVYEAGADIKEGAFDPAGWDLTDHSPSPSAALAYQAGKRRAEALFTQQAPFDHVSVRFPVILGPDDYTRRLEFHVERIERNQTIFVPNLDARISMIHAEDASAFLKWSLTEKFKGPVNVASPQPIRISELLREIETRVGHRALLVKQPTPQSESPYAPSVDCFLNCDLMAQLGFSGARPIATWLGDLIDGARQTGGGPSLLH